MQRLHYVNSPPLQLSHTQGLFLRLDLFYPSLYCVCMSALHRGSMSMTVKDYGGKWGSPNLPSSPCSGAGIPQGIAGRAIETHYCWNHIASEGCKLPGKWMEHTGGGEVEEGVRFSLSTICIDTCDLFLIFWLCEIRKKDLIKFRLGRILMLSSTLKLWNHLWYSCEFRENCSFRTLWHCFISSICGFQSSAGVIL